MPKKKVAAPKKDVQPVEVKVEAQDSYSAMTAKRRAKR